jgi:2-keto-4-pentenoate hydratase/2-oxohepta-3-ene-1,7-dioic acid hydratase in catechol pathway
VSVQKIYRVEHEGTARYVLEQEGTYRLIEGDVFAGGVYKTGAVISARKILSPVAPSKVVAIGLNYKDHAAERNKPLPQQPLMFMKPSTTVIGPGDAIRLPAGAGRVDYEAEMAIVIGRRAYRVAAASAADYILGVTCINDVTARDLQTKDVQYTRAKGFDTFAPIGPCIATGLGSDPRQVEGWVNGQRRQSSSTKVLIFPIEHIVEYITYVMTLEPGDIISTGTPEGVGPLVAGDSVTVKVEGIGELTNPVQDE